MTRRRREITGTSCGAPRLVLVGESSDSASVLVGGSSASELVGATVSGDSTPDRHNNYYYSSVKSTGYREQE